MLLRLPTTLSLAAGLLATVAVAAGAAGEIPTDVPVSSLLASAQSLLSKGETNEALAYYDAAIARDPSNYLTLFKRGATNLSLGRTAQATDDFYKALALEPGFEGAHLQLAKIKARAADWEVARSEYIAAGKSQKSAEVAELDEARGAATLAETAFKNGQWTECVDHADVAIVVATRSPALRQLRSSCRFERGDIEGGVADLQHLLGMRPGDLQPHVVIATTTFYVLGDMDAGVSQIKKCLHSDPDSKLCKKLHKQLKAVQKAFSKASGQLQRGQTTTAGRSLAGTSDDAGLISDLEEQIADLRHSGSIPASAPVKLYNNAIELTCQAFSESAHKDASKYCVEALRLDGNSFWGLIHRGKTQLRQDAFEESIRTFEDALEKHPNQRDKVQPLLNKASTALKRSKTKDYYKVLGVASDADERQIKSAYLKATKLNHPDKVVRQGVSKEEAEKKMAAINEAYEVLRDPELRARFDRGDDPNSQESHNPFQGSPFGGGGGGFQFNFQQGGFRKPGGWPFPGGGGGGGPFGF